MNSICVFLFAEDEEIEEASFNYNSRARRSLIRSGSSPLDIPHNE